MQKVKLQIEGMSCGHCLSAVRQALAAVPGVRVATVQLGRAEVEVPDEAGSDLLVSAVEGAGYTVAFVEPAP